MKTEVCHLNENKILPWSEYLILESRVTGTQTFESLFNWKRRENSMKIVVITGEKNGDNI